MFSTVPATTFGALVATQSVLQEEPETATLSTNAAPAPVGENIAPTLVCESVTPAPLIECSAPALAVHRQSCHSAVEAFAPHVVESSPFSAPTQRSREERDATGRAVASRLGLAWECGTRPAKLLFH